MSEATLRRFDITALRTVSAADSDRVAIPQARIDFYLPGATVQIGATITSGSTSTVTLASIGSLATGDTVIGMDGLILGVAGIVSSTQVSLQNTSGHSAVLTPGMRLINVSRRPEIYQDALGTDALGNFVIADSSGRATAFLAAQEYDYIMGGNAVTVDSTTFTTLTDDVSTMSWNHTAAGTDRIVIVAIAWQESLGGESLDSVTYNTAPMTRIAVGTFVDVYYLLDPPTGSKQIVATWSGSGMKGAIGGATSFTNVDPDHPFLAEVSASGSTSPAASSFGNLPTALIFDALGMNTVPGVATATPASGQTALWNTNAGTAPDSTRTVGAASTPIPITDAVTMSWTLSANRSWSAIIVQLLPRGIRLYTDEPGKACDAVPFSVNAADFASLQDAVDALPDGGGVVTIPPGTYRLRESLNIDRGNIALVGAGATTILTPADPTNEPIDIVTVSASLFRMSNLQLDGASAAQDLDDGTSCLVLNGNGVSGRLLLHTILENVIFQGASRYGIWMRDVITFTAINCQSVFNHGHGMRIQGTDTDVGTSAGLHFIDCSLSQNDGLGVDIGDEAPPETGNVLIDFMGCAFENNQGDGTTLADVGTGVFVKVCPKVSLHSCWFESTPDGTAQFVQFAGCPNSVVDNC
jgi:hypothetical protein